LQDRVINIAARMEQIIDKRVALALSKQSSHRQGPIDEMSPSAKEKSSVSSTEHAAPATEEAAVVEPATQPHCKTSHTVLWMISP
jgi:hypothetical protein